MSDHDESPVSDTDAGADQSAEAVDDLGYNNDAENRAYEAAQPDSQPEVSGEPEPGDEPADAG